MRPLYAPTVAQPAAARDYTMHRFSLTFVDGIAEARYYDLQYVQSGFLGGRLIVATMAFVLHPLVYIMFQGADGFWPAVQDPQPYVFGDAGWHVVHLTWGATLIGFAVLMLPAAARHREVVFLVCMAPFFPCWIPLFLLVRQPQTVAYCYVVCLIYFLVAAQIRFARVAPWLAVTAFGTLIVTVFAVDPHYFAIRSYLELLFWPLMAFVFPLMAVLETHSRRAFVDRERALSAIAASEHKRLVTQRMVAGFFPATPTKDLLRDVGGPRSIAYPATVVVVTDIVQFTAYTSRTDPTAVIAMLTELFHAIDIAAPAHGVEKVSTVGDSYCGAVFPQLPARAPDAEEDQHTSNVEDVVDTTGDVVRCTSGVVFGTQILQFAAGLQMRVGVHFGDVVGGFVGCSPPKFDLFGGAMDHARQMEEGGAPGKVHVSVAVTNTIGDHGRARDAEPTPLGVLCTTWEERSDAMATLPAVSAAFDAGAADAHVATVIESIVDFARASGGGDDASLHSERSDADTDFGAESGNEGRYAFHAVLLEFADARIERQFRRYIRQCGVNDAAAKIFLVMLMYVLLLNEIFGCCDDRDRYASAAIVTLITIMATSVGHFGTNHRLHAPVTFVVYTAIFTIALLATTTDCGGLPRRALYVGNAAFMYFCVAFLATQFVFEAPLKFRVAQLATICAIGVACVAIRRNTVRDEMLTVDPATVMPMLSFAIVSYFVEFSLRTSYAVVSELEDSQRESKGRSARTAATAMSIMLPAFVTDRIVDEAKKAEATLQYQSAASAAGGTSSPAGWTSTSSISGVDIDFDAINVTWDFPHVVVLFATFAAEGLSHDTIDRTMQDMEAAAARYGILKVKTMGSTMLCVAGIGGSLSRAEAVATVVDTARDMRRVVLDPLASSVPGLRYAVGIDSGPCFGAVIGGNGAIFDVFGDTVNTASRMMSTAAHGAIQLGAAAHSALPTDARRLRCNVVQLEPVNVKGKGVLSVFSVEEPDLLGISAMSSSPARTRLHGSPSQRSFPPLTS
jgi:class 3 adenylate cyclase